MKNPYLPRDARIDARIEESRDIYSLHLTLTDDAPYEFAPGQFNMLYVHGVGEVPISIVAGSDDGRSLIHTVRAVGRVTRAMSQLQLNQHIGLRGPYGRGWPLREARGRDLVLVTGGLGCAPAVSIIHEVLSDRSAYGRLSILQGVKHADDLIWRRQYAAWAELPDVQVLLAADVGGPDWPGRVGLVTTLFDQLDTDPSGALAMLCGPEVMMRAAATDLHRRGVREQDIHLSMERNMQCAVGHCGHCQIGGSFVCRNGPVFPWADIRPLLGVRGF